ncbi:neuropeptides capa receptor-like [Bacillus rossius redtenbacheri]|uniref:neuropeptides capa receptor-like n=1 Tax=Bacillus rossius redtenbacheri TaxID=93214 RepID=UPI002FDE6D0E
MNSTDFNQSLEEYLLAVRGPKHLPNSIVVPITVVYVLIFVTGVFGNVAVCLVIVRNASMRTATNYYLFSLSVSDLTLLILGLPYDLGVFWQQYPWSLGLAMCKIRALVSEMSSYTSVLTIVAFSMERYLAICHPLHSYAMSNLERAVKIIAFLWLLSLVSATPFAVFTTVSYVDYPPGSGQEVQESAFCAMLEQDIPEHWPIYEISSCLFFLLPMCVILVLYALMGARIRGSSKDQSLRNRLSSVHGDQRSADSRTRSIIRMLAAVVVAFFLCWAPFHAQRLIYLYGKDAPNYSEINEWMYYITGILYYFSSTVNPILYSVMSARYRVAFRKTICRCLSPSSSNPADDETTSVYRAHHHHNNNNNYNNNGLRYNGSVLSRGRSGYRGGGGSVVVDVGSSSRSRAAPRLPEETSKLIDRGVPTPGADDARRSVSFGERASDVVVVLGGPASNGKAKTVATAAGSHPYKEVEDALRQTMACHDLEEKNNRETHI